MCPVRQKFNTKVLGKEFEEEPFFKRVFLNNIRKSFHKNTTVIPEVFYLKIKKSRMGYIPSGIKIYYCAGIVICSAGGSVSAGGFVGG